MKSKIRVVQAEYDEFLLRLPPKHMINNSIEELCGPNRDENATYDVPMFYTLKLRSADGSPPAVTNDRLNNGDFFLSRVADYTISVCR